MAHRSWGIDNQHLRRLTVGLPISTPALNHIIRLPSLEEFRLDVGNSFQLPDPLPFPIFSSFQKLTVNCRGDLTWLRLLPAIGNPVLRSISVVYAGPDVDQFMETFELTMTGCGMHESLLELVVSPVRAQLTRRMITYGSSFKNLTTLSLHSNCLDRCQTRNLTDDDIELLTRTMPYLEKLALGAMPCQVPSQVTFKSLYMISRRCTGLVGLVIHFDPTQFVDNLATTIQSWDVALGLSDFKTPSSDLCSVRLIVVGDIPLPTNDDAAPILALGLLGVFPKLQCIACTNNDWRVVDKLVKLFRRIGCSAFGKC